MKRKSVGKKILVALLTGMLAFSAVKMPVMATEGQEIHVYTAPTNLRWDSEHPGYAYYDITDGTRGYTYAEIYRNGSRVGGSAAPSTQAGTRKVNFVHSIFESGSYTFKAKLSADNSNYGRDMTSGSISEESPAFDYVRPSQQIGVPTNLRWSTEKPNVAEWDPVENAAEYFVTLYKNDKYCYGIYPGDKTSHDFSNQMVDADTNAYSFCVQAFSKNIEQWANGNMSGKSPAYGGTSATADMQSKIADASTATADNVNDVVGQLKTEGDKDTMSKAIQESEATQQNLSALENTYNQKNGITVTKGSTVDSIPAEGMSVVGAGLNAEAGSTVSLNVSPTPTSPAYDTDIYKNVISFDMKLVNSQGETKTELTQLQIPAVITLPIPAGMNTAEMFILHFKSDGTVEKITPAFIDNYTKAKFTITSFSTFAFAEQDDQVVAFVSRMYTVALGRNYDQAGLNDWSNQLKNKTKDGAGIAQGFIESEEFTLRKLSNEDYLNVLYHTFFDRDPDEGGYNNWLTQLKAGTSRHNVLAGFVNSDEFTNLCNKFGITRGLMENENQVSNEQVRAFVERMYVKALGRAGDEDGINEWTQRIVSGEWKAADVAKAGFFNSDEYGLRSRSNEDFVEDLYQALFDRASDPDGRTTWLSQLSSGASREDVMNGFGNSQEFANMLAGFGL